MYVAHDVLVSLMSIKKRVDNEMDERLLRAFKGILEQKDTKLCIMHTGLLFRALELNLDSQEILVK